MTSVYPTSLRSYISFNHLSSWEMSSTFDILINGCVLCIGISSTFEKWVCKGMSQCLNVLMSWCLNVLMSQFLGRCWQMGVYRDLEYIWQMGVNRESQCLNVLMSQCFNVAIFGRCKGKSNWRGNSRTEEHQTRHLPLQCFSNKPKWRRQFDKVELENEKICISMQL